uniref:Uncharacterized protein n=1 Tax=Arundo donax TaxID=35708 RepID=A0A0A9BB50_ARUDO
MLVILDFFSLETSNTILESIICLTYKQKTVVIFCGLFVWQAALLLYDCTNMLGNSYYFSLLEGRTAVVSSC